MSNTTLQSTVPRQFGLSSGLVVPSLLPARLDAKQSAEVLGFQEHDIPVLISRNLLEPLGKPADNARKYFALVEVLARREDVHWLGKATRTLYQHWQDKNASRKLNGGEETSHAE
jgi:hypothetical protein